MRKAILETLDKHDRTISNNFTELLAGWIPRRGSSPWAARLKRLQPMETGVPLRLPLRHQLGDGSHCRLGVRAVPYLVRRCANFM